MKRKLRLLAMPLLLSVLLISISCGDDDVDAPQDEIIASFSYEAENLEVTFTNNSVGGSTYSWDFGDGETSTEESPIHMYDIGGSYTVVLTATSAAGEVDDFEQSIAVLEDPSSFLHGGSSKTWKLVREGTAMLLASNSNYDQIYWGGSSNNGERACLYDDTFTFGSDGSYTFSDAGTFWAEYGIFNGGLDVTGCDSNTTAEACLDVSGGTLVNECGDDISAWLSGSHSYAYDESSNQITLSGTGAWIGIPKLGTTSGDNITPLNELTFNVVLVAGGTTGVDTMFVNFDYGDNFWPFTYVSYSDASLEPDLVEEFIAPPFGEDLANITPDMMSHTFADASGYTHLGVLGGASPITVGVDDPADASAAKVAQLDRTTAQFQEAKLRAINAASDSLDFILSNVTTISLDVYLPSSNDYSTTLAQQVIVGFADESQTEQWWTDIYQYESADDLATDTWHTLTFTIATPSNRADSPADRTGTELDMFYIGIGGGNHTAAGTFYIRNLVID